MEQRQSWCVTLLAPAGPWKHQSPPTIDAGILQIEQALSDCGIGNISSKELYIFAGSTAASARRFAFDAGSHDVSRLRDRLESERFDADVVLHPRVSASDFKLIVFDLDSTLITCEVIDELAGIHGVGGQVAAITASAMRGEIDFTQSFRQRIAFLRGLEEARIMDFVAQIELTPGAALLIRTLKSAGYRTAIATGGFDVVAARLQGELGIDDFRSNRLEFVDGRLTGEITTTITDAQGKAEFLLSLAKKYGIPSREIIAVGDGANDIPMMQAAGLSVAYRAKPKVKDAATCSFSRVGLDGLLYVLQ